MKARAWNTAPGRPASKTEKSDSRPSDLGIFARFDATDANRTEALPVFHDGHTPL